MLTFRSGRFLWAHMPEQQKNQVAKEEEHTHTRKKKKTTEDKKTQRKFRVSIFRRNEREEQNDEQDC